MSAFTVKGNIIFTYYRDLARAAEFYATVMGLELVMDQGFAKLFQLAPHTYLGLVDGERGTHKASDTKPVIIASISDDVEKWYQHLVDHGVTILKPLKENQTLGLRGFMALDPEGYVLEFEQFFDTERNHALLERLQQA